jgi:hypothetical protein
VPHLPRLRCNVARCAKTGLGWAIVVLFAVVVWTLAYAPATTPAPTPRRAPEHIVSGRVTESPLCYGSIGGVGVSLLPLGRTTRTNLDAGGFVFEGVPDGTYTLHVERSCNPIGCWADLPVVVAGADVSVTVCPQAFTRTAGPVPTPTGGR